MRVTLKDLKERKKAEITEKDVFEERDVTSILGTFQSTDYQAFDSRKEM